MALGQRRLAYIREKPHLASATSHPSSSTGASNSYQKRPYMPPFLIHRHSSSRFSCQRTRMCSAPHERPSKQRQLYSTRPCQRVNITYTTLVRSARGLFPPRPPALLFLHIPSPSPVSPCTALSSIGYIVDHEDDLVHGLHRRLMFRMLNHLNSRHPQAVEMQM